MNQQALYQQSLDYFLAPLRPLLQDDSVTEILINGEDAIYFERSGELKKSSLKFPDALWLAAMAQNIAEFVGRRLDQQNHSLSGRLPETCCVGASRIHVVAPPASRSGYCISIRRFKEHRHSMSELVALDALSEEAAELLRLAVVMKCNIAVSGGTGAGKTTLLNALSAAIPHEERILVIEETSELKLHQPHTVYFETQQGDIRNQGQVTIRDLFVDSLRMRPDRIIVGEVRQGEALDMVQSMLSGHAGALTTVHANTPLDALMRLETLCMMTAEALPHHVAQLQVAAAIHLVVQIERYRGQRRIRSISECCGLNQRNRYRMRPLYKTTYARNQENQIAAVLGRTQRFPDFARAVRGYAASTDFPQLEWLFAAADAAPAKRRNRMFSTKNAQEAVTGGVPKGNSVSRGQARNRC